MASLYKLIHGNSFEWLERRKAKTVHAIVTDPPYGVREYTSKELAKKRSGNGGIWRLPIEYDGSKRKPMPRFTVLKEEDHKKIREFHSELAPLLFKVLVPGGHVIIASQQLFSHFVTFEFCNVGFEIRGQIARSVSTLRGGDRPKGAHQEYPELSVVPRGCWEPWLIFRRPCEGRVSDNLKKWGTGALRRPSENIPFKDLIESGRARGKERKLAPHPSLKPQAFVRQVVRAVLPLEEGVIIDPFMGSGSTIAAAESLGFKSIGIEIDETFFGMAVKAVDDLARIVV